jgi:polysaccharide biosynthesis protein PslA
MSDSFSLWRVEFNQIVSGRRRRVFAYDIAVAMVFVDAIAIISAGNAALSGAFGALLPSNSQWALIAALGFYFALAPSLCVYNPRTVLDRDHALTRLPLAVLATFVFLLFGSSTGKASATQYSHFWFLLWLVSTVTLIVCSRLLIQKIYQHALSEGFYLYKAISVGIDSDPVSSNEIRRNTGNEVHVAASLHLNGVGDLEALSEKIAREEIDRVFVCARWEAIPKLVEDLRGLRHLATRVLVIPAEQQRTLAFTTCGVVSFGDRVMFRVLDDPINGWDLWLKRREDIAIGIASCLLLAPTLIVIALAIKLDSPGPVLFRQTRIGFNGRTFKLWKFRSMFVEKTDAHAAVQTAKHDPRVTRVGRFIRRTSLDELPQIFNVLEGTMSIVGPRPHALATTAEGRSLDDIVEYYAVRHRMKPGITGWAQIHGLRGELDSVEKLRKRVDYDLDYIENWSIWFDLKIILRTILLVFRDEHAY